MTTTDAANELIRRYRGKRLPMLNLCDVPSITAQRLLAALVSPVVIARMPDGGYELLIRREGTSSKPVLVFVANRRQADLFVSASNAARGGGPYSMNGIVESCRNLMALQRFRD
jgi:hypothetical protein